MVGIGFIYPMFKAMVEGHKTQTSRMGSRKYQVGQRLYVKEPTVLWGYPGAYPEDKDVIHQWYDCKFTGVSYLWDGQTAPPETFWKQYNKMFMPAGAARHIIEITNVETKRLGDFDADDYRREGMKEHMAMPLVPGERPTSEWRVDLANDSCFAREDPAEVFRYILKLTAGKDIYDPEMSPTVYQFKLVK